MNPYEYKKEDFLAWLEKRMEKYGYTPENAPDTYSKAYKSKDPKDLPVLITQEWWDYLNPERYENKNIDIKQGERGGLYTEDITKDGRPYRRYF